MTTFNCLSRTCDNGVNECFLYKQKYLRFKTQDIVKNQRNINNNLFLGNLLE